MRRVRLAVLLAFFSLLIAGTATPALAAPPTPTSFRLASNGSGNTSLRVQWTWRAGITSYDLQVATDTAFAHLVKPQSVTGSSSRPSSGVVAVSVSGLKNATTFKLRVRARTGSTTSAWSATLSASTTVHWPGVLGGVTASPGPGVGEITFRWTSDGTYTTHFRVEMALTMFGLTNPGLPRYGRQHTVYKVGRTKRSLTLSAAQVAAAGAGVSTGNHLYYQVFALNWGTAGHQVRQSALLGVRPKPGAPASSGTGIRAASFNVLTANEGSGSRTWLKRAPAVARQIIAKHPGIAAIQELTPGRADGKNGSTKNYPRQTESMLSALRSNGGGNYRLVRTTPHVKPGTTTGTQGARILYDKTKYDLLTACSDKSSGGAYSSSCTIKLPILSGDSEARRRRAAYAEFRDKATQKRFFFVSAHLDARQSSKSSSSRRYNTLRRNQVVTIASVINGLNTRHEPVIIGGDMNSSQIDHGGNGPHDYLVQHGYYDASAAVTAVNMRYPTANYFRTVLKASPQGYGPQIDMIFVQGSTSGKRFENVMKRVDSARPSDHNMVYAELVL
jgi:endonuclease/exonuclease/phosphatase family metal-dependent hydrolase